MLSPGIIQSTWNCEFAEEVVLNNYPRHQWKLKLNVAGTPQFEPYRTVSRYLASRRGSNPKICPYGDAPAPVASLERTDSWCESRDAYSLSALRFKLSPFSLRQTKSRPSNQKIGWPTAVKHLYKIAEALHHQVDEQSILEAATLSEFETALALMQMRTREWFVSELLPCMNANPLDAELHRHELSPELTDDLKQYVRLQNSPLLFFDLMQWIERDVAKFRRICLLAGETITTEAAMTRVMRHWRDRDGHRRKKPIVFPMGVPIGYIQSIRRKDQPFMTREFGYHSHGAMNHWLQEHIWRRFCYRYPDQHQLHPCEFLKKLGSVHFAIPDAIYELHAETVANPANTHFWAVLQYYFPLMSPWP